MPMTHQQGGRRADPRTKEDFLDRMMARDFSGDLADLAAGRKLGLERLKPHVIRLRFGDSGKVFDLTIHKPRSEAPATIAKLKTKQAVSKKRAGARRRKQESRARKSNGATHHGSAARH